MPFYHFYELNHAALAPWRAVADATRLTFQNPFHPLYDTPFARSITAAAEMFERTTRRYGKPDFGHHHDDLQSTADPSPVSRAHVVWEKAVLQASALQARPARRQGSRRSQRC